MRTRMSFYVFTEIKLPMASGTIVTFFRRKILHLRQVCVFEINIKKRWRILKEQISSCQYHSSAHCVRSVSLQNYRDTGIGGHLLRHPWSEISDWAWYQNFRYRTEDIRHYIRYRNKLFIRHPKIQRSVQWQRSMALTCVNKGLGFDSCGCD